MPSTNVTAPTLFLQAGGQSYAYRRWDPAVTDPLALGREVILFENAVIGRSTGTVPESIAAMAQHVLKFLDGLGQATCDVLGFSLGGMIAQQIAKDRPSTIRRMILFAPTDSSQADACRERNP